MEAGGRVSIGCCEEMVGQKNSLEKHSDFGSVFLMKLSPVLSFAALAVAGLPAQCLFAEPSTKPPARKEPPSAEQVAKAAVVAHGLQIEVWAAEPLLANPVAFAFDNQGRAWVAETNRRKSSYLDIRSFPDWVPQSLALRSVEERTAFLKKSLPEGAATWPKSMRDLNERTAHQIY